MFSKGAFPSKSLILWWVEFDAWDIDAAGLLPGTNFKGVVGSVVCIRVGSLLVTDVEVFVWDFDGTFWDDFVGIDVSVVCEEFFIVDGEVVFVVGVVVVVVFVVVGEFVVWVFDVVGLVVVVRVEVGGGVVGAVVVGIVVVVIGVVVG